MADEVKTGHADEAKTGHAAGAEMGGEVSAKLEAKVDAIVRSAGYAEAKKEAEARAAKMAATYNGEWRKAGPVWPKGATPTFEERVEAGLLWQAEACRRLGYGTPSVLGMPYPKKRLLGLAIQVEKDKAELAKAKAAVTRDMARAEARAAAAAAEAPKHADMSTGEWERKKKAKAERERMEKAEARTRAEMRYLRNRVNGDSSIKIDTVRHTFHGTVSRRGRLTYGGSLEVCQVAICGPNQCKKLCGDCFPATAAEWDFRDGVCQGCADSGVTVGRVTLDATAMAKLAKGSS